MGSGIKKRERKKENRREREIDNKGIVQVRRMGIKRERRRIKIMRNKNHEK